MGVGTHAHFLVEDFTAVLELLHSDARPHRCAGGHRSFLPRFDLCQGFGDRDQAARNAPDLRRAKGWRAGDMSACGAPNANPARMEEIARSSGAAED